jgi:hypothetical protein
MWRFAASLASSFANARDMSVVFRWATTQLL